jgi:4,5-dihydroxyphthalate decarboxylase
MKPLFADSTAEGVRYYRKTGLYPINHGMVIRRTVAEAHPWVVLNLLKAFVRANEIAEAERQEHIEYHVKAGLVPQETADALRRPLIRHGVVANLAVLDTAAQYSHEQGLTPRRLRLDELFAASTLDQ